MLILRTLLLGGARYIAPLPGVSPPACKPTPNPARGSDESSSVGGRARSPNVPVPVPDGACWFLPRRCSSGAAHHLAWLSRMPRRRFTSGTGTGTGTGTGRHASTGWGAPRQEPVGETLRLRLTLVSRWRRQASRPVLNVAGLRLRAACSPILPAGAIATLAFVGFSDRLIGGVKLGSHCRRECERSHPAPDHSRTCRVTPIL